MNMPEILIGILFGGVGFAAFVYGKKEKSAKPMLIGAGLMVCPYLTRNLYLQLAIGAVLIALLFLDF
jgi:hypothetical protein